MAETQETAGSLFRSGNLTAAIDAANANVRAKPGEFTERVLLAELLVFAGNIQRADLILDAAALSDPSTAVVVAEFRQLLRAELARRQCLTEGRVPEFIGEPTEALQAALATLVALRNGENDEAARQAAEVEAKRPRVAGVMKLTDAEVSFDDFRDADDLYAGFFEVLTTTGKYFWIPTERVSSIELHPPRRPRDLAWRRASMSVIDGPDGEVYLPALYVSAEAAPADNISLGRTTEWLGEEGGFVRGIGQRVFLIGDDAYAISDLSDLQFNA
jgi:type VI secretion system protein ImpE